MARGSLAGIVSGVVVSGLGLGVASLSLPPVEMGAAPPAAVAESPVLTEPEGAPAPGAGEAADGELTPEAAAAVADEGADAPEEADAPDTGAGGEDSAPEPEQPDPPEAEPAAEAPTGDETGADPATAPGTDADGDEDTGEDASARADDTPKRGEAAEAEITPQPTGTPLPETDRAPHMENDPVKVPMVEPEEPAAIPGTELVEKLPPALPPASGEEMPAEDAPAEAAGSPDTSEDKATGNALVVEPEPVAEPAAEAEPAPEADPEPAPEIATIVAEPAPNSTPESAPVAAAPEPAPTPEAETEPAPATGLSGADSVVTGRLPTIGGDSAEPAPEAEAPAAEVDPAALAGLPAIERNRIEFTLAGDQPLLALLLLDSGDRAALEDIGKLPFPLTVAVDAGAPDAAEAIAFYDTRGIEVALLLPLPDGATPTDVDVTIEAYGPLLAEAAEVVVDPALGFQALGAGATQLATNLAESGHGLVSFPSGLNTGHKAAEKLGVPAGLVFLDLDGEGQGAPVIRRFLDNAAFRARNEDGVIVLARTRAETLQALLEWSLGNRAQTVTLAPISAVLLGQ